MPPFELDGRLAADSRFVTRLDLCQVRLIDDARWPWLVLVPERAAVSELFDLAAADRAVLADETTSVGERLKRLTGCAKINVGALGNQVAQLHVHFVARSPGDAAWPGPVWGAGERLPYTGHDAQTLVKAVLDAL